MQLNSNEGEIIIFHTNDMHARVSTEDDSGNAIGLAEIAGIVNAAKLSNKNVYWFDAGDTLHGMPRINVSEGENMVDLLNETPLDAMCPGNHDYNYGSQQLTHLASRLKAEVLSANTIYSDSQLDVFLPYTIYVIDNMKMGVFGLTTPETAYKTNPKNVQGIEFLNPIRAAQDTVDKLRGECDIIVAVMHMGLDQSSDFTSERIAAEVDGIDVIIDGHSHTALPNGLTVGNTLIVQTGWHDHKLGKVVIYYKNNKIIDKQATLIAETELTNTEPDPNVITKLEEIDMYNQLLFNRVVAVSPQRLTSNRLVVRRQESALGNLCADAFKWTTHADIAVMNGGGLRADLPAGNVTKGDIMAIFPFGNTIQMTMVSGQTIKEMLEHSVYGYPASFGGFLNVSGLEFTFDPTKPIGSRIVDIQVDGKPIVYSRMYTLAANDFLFVGGDDYNMFTNTQIIGEFETCEEVLAKYLNECGLGDIFTTRIHKVNDIPLPTEIADGDNLAA